MIYHKKKVAFYRPNKELYEIIELHEKGYTLICPYCRSELIVAITPEEAEIHDMHPGIVCPIDHKHVCVVIDYKRKI